MNSLQSRGCPCYCQNKISNVHVLGIVSSEGDIMSPHFFKKGETHKRSVFARSDGCREAMDGNCGVQKAICFSAGRCTDSYESFDSKLALRQRRYILVQGMASQ